MVEHSSCTWAPLCDLCPEALGVPHAETPSTWYLASSTSGYVQLVARFGKRYRHLASGSQSVQEGRGKETCLFQGLDIIAINSLDLNLDLQSCSPFHVIYLHFAFTNALC